MKSPPELVLPWLTVSLFLDQRFMIPCVQELLTTGRCVMFGSRTRFRIHSTEVNCQELEPTEDATLTDASLTSDSIAAQIDGFPWKPRAIRLWNFLGDKVTSRDEKILNVFIVDLLRFCVTPANKFSTPAPSGGDKKMLQVLKQLKKQGLQIPQVFITRQSVKLLFS